jgi:hypothetical protein
MLRRKDNIKIGLRGMWFGYVGWFYVAENRVQHGGDEHVN